MRRAGARWVRVLVALVLLGVLAESAARLLGAGRPVAPLLREEVAGQAHWRPNPDFYTVVCNADEEGFAPDRAHAFLTPAEKPPDTIRVVVFGESAAVGEPPDSAYGFWRILGAMLHAAFPEYDFEILPLACSATDSYCMYSAAQSAAALEPDFFLVYMGNNEVTGDYGVYSRLMRHVDSVHVARFHAWLLRAHSVQVSRALLEWVVMGLLPDARPDPRDVFAALTQYAPDSPETRACIERFRVNLAGLCAAGTASGARVAVSTLASNLRAWEPFASAHGPGWDASRAAAWEQAMDDADTAAAAGRWADAARHYAQALAMDEGYARAHFQLANCLYALGEWDAARAHFVKARDLDRMQVRASTAMNDAIRATVRAFGSPDVTLVEGERAVWEQSPNGVPGWESFYDMLHFRHHGAHALAEAFFAYLCVQLREDARDGNAAGPCSPLSPADTRRALALTPEVELRHLEHVDQGMLAGLREVCGVPWLVEEVAAERAALEGRIARRSPGDMLRDFADALARNPGDAVVRYRYAQTLRARGMTDEARRVLRSAEADMPRHPAAMALLRELESGANVPPSP